MSKSKGAFILQRIVGACTSVAWLRYVGEWGNFYTPTSYNRRHVWRSSVHFSGMGDEVAHVYSARAFREFHDGWCTNHKTFCTCVIQRACWLHCASLAGAHSGRNCHWRSLADVPSPTRPHATPLEKSECKCTLKKTRSGPG